MTQLKIGDNVCIRGLVQSDCLGITGKIIEARQSALFGPRVQRCKVDFNGKVLLQAKDSLALSPNGHGGSLMALWKSGAIADMKKRGITQISYFQVDNPIVRCVDPLFLGLHDLDGAQMSSKMLPKVAPREKLGNFALIDGKMIVIEYSDLPDELAEQRLPNGELRFRSGSIALHEKFGFQHIGRHGVYLIVLLKMLFAELLRALGGYVNAVAIAYGL